MSTFSHALALAVEEAKITQAALAQKSGLSPGMISRYMMGAYRPDKESLTKLCLGLPEHCACKVVAAHLKDETPEEMTKFILVLAESKVKEDEPVPSDLANLNTRTRKAVLFLARLALKDSDAQDMLQSMARYLGCKI